MLRILIQIFHDIVHRNAPGCAGIQPQYAPRPVSHSISVETPTYPKPPTISVVIPSFNQGQFIEQTIQSVLEQDYPALELIVVDGGSTDRSIEVIQRYADRLAWWVSEPDSGQAEAINKGMQHTSGEIMAWLNSDDMLMPGSLHRVAQHFSESPKTDVVYGHRIMVDQEGLDIGRWVLPRHDDFVLSYADYIPQETLFWRRTAWEKSGGKVNENYQFALDWELIVRFLKAGAKFHRLPKFLGRFRIHSQQKTSARIEDTGFNEMEQIRAEFLDQYTGKYRKKTVEHLRLLNLALYMLKAKITEISWRWGLIKID